MKMLVARPRPRGFTLTELLVVLGLVVILVSLLLPVLGRARAAAEATRCLSNVRQMGVAWTMYLAENKGRLPDYVWSTPTAPDQAWRGYWLGILDSYKVRGDALLCPTADAPIPFNNNRGFGNVRHAWTGRYHTAATVVRLAGATYREGSYGYNRYLTAGGGFGGDGKASRINAVDDPSDVPVFFDAVFADVRPLNGSEAFPVAPPPNLGGHDFPPNAPEHWRFLIARHGRGVNVCTADGAARWVPLEETYTLAWKAGWAKYRLPLPTY